MFARWTDKKYYSGRLQERCKDGRLKVLFDDTSVKLLVEDFVIAVDQLPMGQLVYALAESGDYESGVIVNVEKYVPLCYCKVGSLFRKTRLHSHRKLPVYIYIYIYIICCVQSLSHCTCYSKCMHTEFVSCRSFLVWVKTKIGQCLRLPIHCRL